MRKLIVVFIFIVFGSASFAQTSYLWLTKSDTTGKAFRGILDLQGSATAGSTFLTKELVKPFAVGGIVTAEARNSAVDGMSDLGVFGGNANVRARYYGGRDSLFGSEMLDLFIQVGKGYFGSGRISKDAFDLLSNGNVNFQGVRVPLNSIQGEVQGFQSIGFGIYDKRTFSSIGISMVNGLTYQQFSLFPPSSFYTSANADTLQLDYSGEYVHSAAARPNGNGIGFSIDGEYNFVRDRGVDKKEVWNTLGVRNLGWVNWNGQSEVVSFDSTLTWTGVDLNGILNGDSLLNGTSGFADTLVTNAQNVSFWRPLRGSFYVRSVYRWSEKVRLTAGLEMYAAPMKPLATVGFMYMPKNNCVASINISNGGYANWKLGMGVQWLIANQFYLGVQTSNVPGYFFKSAREMQASIQVSYLFKTKKKDNE
ncbi:MAG: hypothetical protein RLZZ71_2103 [Bacteroidota bacterium]|jgi:hypothetical protein